jgi:hypothetical protein
MNTDEAAAPTLRIVLLELVAALDRRVPRLNREGERDIVRDAQELRRAALKRIAELEQSVTVPARGRSGTVPARGAVRA